MATMMAMRTRMPITIPMMRPMLGEVGVSPVPTPEPEQSAVLQGLGKIKRMSRQEKGEDEEVADVHEDEEKRTGSAERGRRHRCPWKG